jgi:hypothetical protein
MKKLIETIAQAFSDVVHSSFLLIIFLFFMTGLGNVLFGGKMNWCAVFQPFFSFQEYCD